MTIDAEDLRAQCLKMRYSRRLVEPEVFPSEQEWEYITGRAMTGIGSSLYRKYLVSWSLPEDERTDIHCSALQWFPQYIAAVPRDYALGVVYGDISSCPQATLAVIYKARLFDADMLRDVLHSTEPLSPPFPQGYYPLTFVVECLDAYQPEYTDDTLESMRELYRDITDPEPPSTSVRKDTSTMPAKNTAPNPAAASTSTGCANATRPSSPPSPSA